VAKQNERAFALLKQKISIPLAEIVREDGIAFPALFSGFCYRSWEATR